MFMAVQCDVTGLNQYQVTFADEKHLSSAYSENRQIIFNVD